MYKCTLIDKISFILVLIGSLNLGILGVWNFNILESILIYPIVKIIYILIGLSSINILLLIYKSKRITLRLLK